VPRIGDLYEADVQKGSTDAARSCLYSLVHDVKKRTQNNNKKFELMLTRRAKAYSNPGSVV